MKVIFNLHHVAFAQFPFRFLIYRFMQVNSFLPNYKYFTRRLQCMSMANVYCNDSFLRPLNILFGK